MLIFNKGAPQGCVLSHLLYSLFTHDCIARHDSNTIFKLADDITVVGLITDNDETAYREKVRDLNVIKTKEMILDYRKRRTEHAPILIDVAAVERVESFRFLGVHINKKLSWSKHTKTVKRALQSLFRLKRLNIFGMGPQILKKLFTIESTGCITAWYGNCSASNSKALQRVVIWPSTSLGARFLPSWACRSKRRLNSFYQAIQLLNS
jgi:hypothetical protein